MTGNAVIITADGTPIPASMSCTININQKAVEYTPIPGSVTVEVVIWWLFQLTAIQGVIALFRLLDIYEKARNPRAIATSAWFFASLPARASVRAATRAREPV